jgi:23S rRNA (guanosine2251-2'-O)-methyltransferase
MKSDQIVTGRKPVLEALHSSTRIEKIVILAGTQGEVMRSIRSRAKSRGVSVVELNREEFQEITRDGGAQGVAAIVAPRVLVSLESIIDAAARKNQPPFVLILDEIEDPHNLGALIRSAECAGAHGVIIPKHHAATVTSTVVKASAGATEHIAITEVTNIVNTIRELKDLGLWVIGLDGSAAKTFQHVDYTSPIAIVVGNEGRGIRRLVREHCDHLVRIPLFGSISSLNASVAGAIVMFAAAMERQRSTQG